MYEMTGRVSEESNESFNATLAEIKDRVKTMASHTQRIEITNARTQGNLKGEILDEKVQLKRATMGNKRGPQKARAQRVESGAVMTLGCQYVSFKGESYFKLSNGNMIPRKWQDIYEWVAGGIAPLVWREALSRTAPDSQTAREKAKEEFSQF